MKKCNYCGKTEICKGSYPEGCFLENDIIKNELKLTKQEYFAAKAMQGLLSNSEWMKEYKGEKYLMEIDIISDVSLRISDNILSKLNEISK